MDTQKSCLNCKHYTDDIGKKGYCKLYRHNTSSPEYACPKFDTKESKERKVVINMGRMKELVITEDSMKKYKSSVNRMLLILSVVCTTVLSVLLLIFSAILCATLAAFEEVRLLHRVIFIVVVGSFVVSLIVIVGMLVSKFRVMSFIIPLLSLMIMILLLIFSNEIWLDFHALIMDISKTIFNVAV